MTIVIRKRNVTERWSLIERMPDSIKVFMYSKETKEPVTFLRHSLSYLCVLTGRLL